MVHLGNHLKMNLPAHLRARASQFYAGLLECKVLESPLPNLDLYEFAGSEVLGLFFVDAADAPTEADYLKATWLELKVDDPTRWKARLQAFGVREVAYPDPTRFYFQAPGGPVFRLASMDGGV
jgi:hypothetical protein